MSGGADGDGGLADDRARAGQVGREGAGGAVDLAGVVGAAVRVDRGAHGEEVHVGEGGGLFDAGGEAQLPGSDVFREEFGQTGFVDRGFAAVEPVDAGLVEFHTDDLVAELGHAGGVRDAQVAAADDGDAHLDPHCWCSGPDASCRSVPATLPLGARCVRGVQILHRPPVGVQPDHEL